MTHLRGVCQVGATEFVRALKGLVPESPSTLLHKRRRRDEFVRAIKGLVPEGPHSRTQTHLQRDSLRERDEDAETH